MSILNKIEITFYENKMIEKECISIYMFGNNIELESCLTFINILFSKIGKN